jgi:leader peptidase (prepilin peptidase)/N-methyltransferase
LPEAFIALIAALFGLLIGSFLNVCIYRWPRDLSVVRPRSACPECDRPIAWYDNIPLLSYLLLRGRCRHCQARIHWRYPVVELLTAGCFCWFAAHLGLSLAAAKYCIFAALIIGMMFSDLDTLILPDEFTMGGLAIGLVLAWFVPVPDFTFGMLVHIFGNPGPRATSFGEAVFGAFVPSVALWFAGWLFEKLRHKEGLGFGDVKMIAMVGAFLGIGGALLTVVLGSVLGSVAGLIYIKVTSKDASSYPLPLGTFLGVAALFAAMAGQNVIGWYGGMLR